MKYKFGFKNQQHNEQLSSIPFKFEATHNEETKESEITIYGLIGESFWYDSISANDVVRELNNAGNNDVVIRLNSPGGDAFDGITIHNRIKEHKGKVTVRIDGYACSAASLIPPAADEAYMGIGSMIMIHEASTGLWGTKNEFRKKADLLEKLEDGIVDIYMTKSKVSREKIREMVDAETWFSASEAVEIGFATATSSVEDKGESEELTQMKAQMQAMQSKINELTNQTKEEPTPVEPVKPTAKRKGFFF